MKFGIRSSVFGGGFGGASSLPFCVIGLNGLAARTIAAHLVQRVEEFPLPALCLFLQQVDRLGHGGG